MKIENIKFKAKRLNDRVKGDKLYWHMYISSK